MPSISSKIFKILTDNEPNRLRGEQSSKRGRDYEEKASYYILERFSNITKVKSKISKIAFNILEDLDIFDNEERIFTFQIKKNKNIWEKSDNRLSEFIIRCIKRNILLKRLKYSDKVRYYFFTNKTGRFLEEWKKLQQKFPDKLYNSLPINVKNYFKNKINPKLEKEGLVSNIFFIVGQRDSFLNMYVDNKLLQRFKEFKINFDSNEFVEINLYNEAIYHERRVQIAKINEPVWEPDVLISNTLEMKLSSNFVSYTKLKEGVSKKDIRDFLKSSKLFMSFFIKGKNLYSFQKFDNQNPLIRFTVSEAPNQKIEFNALFSQDKINFLNDWIYNYLCYLNLKYYGLNYKRIFYFHKRRRNKNIFWRDPSSSKRKEWKVVQNRSTHYLNVAAEISAKCYNNIYMLVIKPRLLFTKDGETLLSSEDIQFIETRYRKSFMKNDFLRRWFFMILSFIKKEEKQLEQTELNKFSNNNKPNNRKIKKKYFLDEEAILFKDPFIFKANFRPNNEKSNSIEIT